MRKLYALLLCLMILFTCCLTGCRQKDDENELSIYVANFGYGYEWLQPLMDDFIQQDWVKEKYPNLKMGKLKTNSVRNDATDQIKSEKTAVDLFFACATGTTEFGQTGSNGEPVFEDLQDVYDSKVPTEDVSFKDKMIEEFLTMNTYEPYRGEEKFYSVPWITGMQGLVYNKTMFDENEWKIPNTTNELLELCKTIKKAGKTPLIFTSKENYWTCTMFLIWWGQYEGVDNYANFYQGRVLIDPVDKAYEYTNKVFEQKGRLESLKVIESLIHADNAENYVHQNVNTLQFSQAQAKFLTREGAMMPNGDWVEAEMRETAQSGHIKDEFTFMKSPVISSIINKCETINDEATLTAVITAIDNGSTSYVGVSPKDFAKIKEARNTVLPVGSHTIMIPAYSNCKEPAKDFIRYLATDRANRIFMKYSYGASMPFKYDVESKDPELYNQFTLIQKDRIQLSKNANFLLNEYTYKMVYLGGIARMSQGRTNIEALFTAQNKADRKSAEQIFEEEIDYWNETKFSSAMTLAGLKE